MFEQVNQDENIGPLVKPPRKLQSEAEHIHRAVFTRAQRLMREMPGSNIQQELQDLEPRAILWAEVDRRLIRKEFFESNYSADEQRFLEEYVRAARECGHIGLLYPGQSFPEDLVLRKIGQIYDKIRQVGIQGEMHVHGFLYDYEGVSRLIV